jgi:hypothetical protein
MKKIILSTLLVLAMSFTYAQKAQFGITTGVDFASAKLNFPGGSSTESETGFYVGGLVDIAASDKFHVQPELLFVFIKDSKQLQLPILAKLFLAEKFSVLVGPDLLFDLDGDSAGTKSMGVGFDFGGAYDIDKNFSIEAKYNLGITNLLKDAPNGFSGKINGLFVGLGYKF